MNILFVINFTVIKYFSSQILFFSDFRCSPSHNYYYEIQLMLVKIGSNNGREQGNSLKGIDSKTIGALWFNRFQTWFTYDSSHEQTFFTMKFRFSKKAAKFETISHRFDNYLIKLEIVSNVCGLFRMSELYCDQYSSFLV